VGVRPLFELELPHGTAVALAIPPSDLSELEALLPREELEVASTWAPARKRTWIAGRAALRLAVERSGLTCPAVLAGERGAPGLPPWLTGSISHKEQVAVALVARQPGSEAIGIDVEVDAPSRVDIARKVLTPDELTELEALPEPARGVEVKLRFSAKEALYKALDPFVRRYVGFHEVTVRPLEGGAARVELRLRTSEGPFDVDVTWLRRDGFIVTTSKVRQA